MKIKNLILRKIVSIALIVLVTVLIIIWSASIILKSLNSLAYDLGEKSSISTYQDQIIKDYQEYLELVKKFNIPEELTEQNFESHNYIASFIDYDKCAESKLKEVQSIDIGQYITITYKVFNKCGWCKSHLALHLIKIDKINEDKQIIYKYNYQKDIDCLVDK